MPIECSGSPAFIRECSGSLLRADLNTRLDNASFNLVADTIHDDVLQLANGHWIILTSSTRDLMNLNGLAKSMPAGAVLTHLPLDLSSLWRRL